MKVSFLSHRSKKQLTSRASSPWPNQKNLLKKSFAPKGNRAEEPWGQLRGNFKALKFGRATCSLGEIFLSMGFSKKIRGATGNSLLIF